MLVANFTKRGEEIAIDGLWMYDYGQKLQIAGLELPDVFEVNFTWKGLESTKTVTGNTKNGISSVDIPNESLKQNQAITAYIYLSTPETGKTVNTIMMFVRKRPAPESLEIPGDIDLFHYTLLSVGEYTKQVKEAVIDAEAWTHAHSKRPERDEDNAMYYAKQAKIEATSVTGRAEKAKKTIDEYIEQKEAELKGNTGNVFFAAFRVANGRLKMYSDPTVDKVCFQRRGSRLKYRLKI